MDEANRAAHGGLSDLAAGRGNAGLQASLPGVLAGTIRAGRGGQGQGDRAGSCGGEAIYFAVPGTPIGKQRPKVDTRGKFARVYTPEKTANYEGLVAHSAQAVMAGRAPIAGPVSVELDIRLPIPASWSKKRQALAAAGAIAATKKPDIDNVEKAIFDGMNGVVWGDDVQVVQVAKRKRYAETPGVVVIVRQLEVESA